MAKFKVEVIADNSGKWASNQKTFDTEEEAEAYAKDLFSRWMAVKEYRVVPVEGAPKEEAAGGGNEASFTIRSVDPQGYPMPVKVDDEMGSLSIAVDGYGLGVVEVEVGEDGELRVLVWADPSVEEPSNVIEIKRFNEDDDNPYYAKPGESVDRLAARLIES